MPNAIKGSTPVQFRLPNSDLRTLRRISKRLGWPVAELMRRAVAEYLDRQEGSAA